MSPQYKNDKSNRYTFGWLGARVLVQGSGHLQQCRWVFKPQPGGLNTPIFGNWGLYAAYCAGFCVITNHGQHQWVISFPFSLQLFRYYQLTNTRSFCETSITRPQQMSGVCVCVCGTCFFSGNLKIVNQNMHIFENREGGGSSFFQTRSELEGRDSG